MKNFILRALSGFSRSRGETTLYGTFNSDSSIQEAISFEECGLPRGKTTVAKWILNAQSAAFQRTIWTSDGEQIFHEETVTSRSNFYEFINRIQKMDSVPIQNYSAPIRDGVVFFIAWGSQKEIRSVTISNPSSDTRQMELISFLKENFLV